MSGRQAQALGRWGEELVAADLCRRGLRLLASGFRCRYGEIDLIAVDDKYIIFTEVKLRRSAAGGPACGAVDARKQRCLRAAASVYLAAHPTPLQPRFDVAQVYAPDGQRTREPVIEYIVNAF